MKRVKLDYERLVRSYNEQLDTQLRHFGLEFDFLDTWVPEEDIERSLEGLVEAAVEGGFVGELWVVLREKPGEEVLGYLREKLPEGCFKWEEEERCLIFYLSKSLDRELKNKRDIGAEKGRQIKEAFLVQKRVHLSLPEPDKRALLDIHPYYLKKTAQFFLNKRHCKIGRENPVEEGKCWYRAQVVGVLLECLVDKGGRVERAVFAAPEGPIQGVMEAFCRVIEGKPLQEASDHGVLYTEESLREDITRGVQPGITTAENACSIFSIPRFLIRRIWQDFLKQAPDFKKGANFWSSSPSLDWLKLGEGERIKRIESALFEALKRYHLQPHGIEVKEIVHDTRVILRFVQDPAFPSLVEHLIKIEAYIQRRVEPTLELLCEERPDRSERFKRNPPPRLKEV